MARRFIFFVVGATAFLTPPRKFTKIATLRARGAFDDGVRREVEAEERRRRQASLEAAEKRSQLEALNAAFRSSGGEAEREGVPIHASAPWTYLPGQREVLRVHEPALAHLFREVVLPSESREYVHVLAGSDVGVVVRGRDGVVRFSRDSRDIRHGLGVGPSSISRAVREELWNRTE